jgi:hypothetical protein
MATSSGAGKFMIYLLLARTENFGPFVVKDDEDDQACEPSTKRLCICFPLPNS